MWLMHSPSRPDGTDAHPPEQRFWQQQIDSQTGHRRLFLVRVHGPMQSPLTGDQEPRTHSRSCYDCHQNTTRTTLREMPKLKQKTNRTTLAAIVSLARLTYRKPAGRFERQAQTLFPSISLSLSPSRSVYPYPYPQAGQCTTNPIPSPGWFVCFQPRPHPYHHP